MVKNKSVLVQEAVPLSASSLWNAQKAYYQKLGVQAWKEAVPFYITSNPFIARYYAEIILRFTQDWVRLYPKQARYPFYIVELGAGSGQFSYYILNALHQMKKTLGRLAPNIRYVMTDVTNRNIRFWSKHPELQSYMKTSMLDFAQFDVETCEPIILIQKKSALNAARLKNPLIVIANYLFDSVKSDCFHFCQQRCFEGLVSLRTLPKNLDNQHPVDWKHVKFRFKDRRCEVKEYYRDDLLNTILREYQQQFEDSCVLLPTYSLQALNHLRTLAKGQLLLLSSDKGFGSVKEMEGLDYPHIDVHGSLSVMVNYHAIARYVQLTDGDAVLQAAKDDIVTGAFLWGTDFRSLPETNVLIQGLHSGLTPSDYFNCYEWLDGAHPTLSLRQLASFLALSHWDPYIFKTVRDSILAKVEGADTTVVDYLADHMSVIADNFYEMPGSQDIYFDIGLFFQEIERFDQAAVYYRLSGRTFGLVYATAYNLGVCWFNQEAYKQASIYFKKALALKPNSREVARWVKKCVKMI